MEACPAGGPGGDGCSAACLLCNGSGEVPAKRDPAHEQLDIKMAQMAARYSHGAAAGGRSFFRPALFWQELLEDGHVCDAGLEFKMNFETGKNQCRFPTKGMPIEDDAERLAAAVKAQTTVVPESQARDDTEVLSKKLLAAATWGDAELVARLLRTCWVTQSVALPALAEAAARGKEQVTAVLLRAGVDPARVVPGRPSGKNALHLACEAGQEATASLLLDARWMPNSAAVMRRTAAGFTFLELLRNQDMGSVARRLEAALTERQRV